ncbi:transcription termination factor Rho [Parafrankia discariae]|uniref:transcription termination factor Rho n=1 Tax=Parafrankia discariae TaxID=365528 RepID=UPI0003622720|nr:transcription termination factor Rho [Parafrankia discariae]
MSDTTDVLPDSARESAAPASPVDSSAVAGATSVDTVVTTRSNGNHAVRSASVDVPADGPDGSSAPRRRRSGTGLSAMLLPELQAMASQMGIPGVGRLRKGQLIAAIQNVQNGEVASRSVPSASTPTSSPASGPASAAPAVQGTPPAAAPAADTVSSAPRAAVGSAAPVQETNGSTGVEATVPAGSGSASGSATETASAPTRVRGRRGASRGVTSPAGEQQTLPTGPGSAESSDDTARPPAAAAAAAAADGSTVTAPAAAPVSGRAGTSGSETAPRGRDDRRERSGDRDRAGDRDRSGGDRDRSGGDRDRSGDRQGRSQPAGDRDRGDRSDRTDRTDRTGSDRSRTGERTQPADRSPQGGSAQDEDEFGNRRRGRFRERGRNRGRGGQGGTTEPEPTVREDDVLVPVAGILDVLDNYAFVRTSGYLTGPTDVYVSLAQVRRNGLRRGDAITGVVRAPQEGEQRRDKYNALVRLDTINGMEPEEARGRPEFHKLTPLYPQDRLRLETEPHMMTTRVIDLVMPIGKGQRALIVSPPKAGKTMVLQSIANAITTNNPECHLMVVLVDERPEEVTDMQRSVKGEVVASTFDRPPADHTNVAELSIERAKRLVELGHDVVVLLDSITRLGRAYNLAAPASGRILSGGVDSTALYPPKRFLGAARNIENGGSLTIIATALVETGSTMDTVIFEEFKGTGNAELKLDRKIADKRVFPAVDVDASGTRKEDILLAPDELAIMHKLRRVLHTREPQQALDLLLDRLKQTRTNYEFLMQIAKTAPPQD